MYKYIVTHRVKSGTRFSNAVMIANHYGHSLKSFKDMFMLAKCSFPSLTEEEANCRTVVTSSWCKGCAVLTFRVPVDSVVEGWTNVAKINDVYFH